MLAKIPSLFCMHVCLTHINYSLTSQDNAVNLHFIIVINQIKRNVEVNKTQTFNVLVYTTLDNT